jgi:putative serine protease PepD
MVRLSGQRGVPVTVIDGQVVVGYDQRRLTTLLNPDGARKPTLGVSIADAARIVERHGNRLAAGAYVGRVTAGSAAERAGLRQGDVITELGSHPIRTAADVHAIMAHHRPGDRIGLTLKRGGHELRLVVKI